MILGKRYDKELTPLLDTMTLMKGPYAGGVTNPEAILKLGQEMIAAATQKREQPVPFQQTATK